MKPRMTQIGANKRLATYLVAAGTAYVIDKGQTPPRGGWATFLFVIGLVGALAITYRAFIDSSDPDAKANDQAGVQPEREADHGTTAKDTTANP